jgi:EAL domain-containing protein (putative c-di-GMP-specific phosphodiesterase class I)/putative methionine-R-sulfoxide reductase with GAF domain
MSPHEKPQSVVSLEAARRRQSPPDALETLRSVLALQGEIAAAGLDLHKVVDVITHRAQELTHSTGAVLEMFEGDELVYWSASGSVVPFVGLRVKADRSLSGLAASMGKVLVCEDSEIDPRVDRDMCRRVGLRSMVTAPLPYAGTHVGVLKVMSPFTKAYGPQDVEILEHLNTLIGAAIAHAAEHTQLAASMSAAVEAKREEADVAAAVNRQQRALRRRLKNTIAAQDFRVVYQPICNLQTYQLVGHEALARFNDQRSPEVWFAEARRLGMGAELELALARKAMEVLSRWDFPTYLAINLSPATILNDEVDPLCAAGDASKFVIEMTEHTQVDDYAKLADRIESLRRRGVRFAVDDAGAGFASLRHVLRIRPDFIKLDRSITHNIDAEPGHRSLTSALLTFAEGTSAAIVAEGIETKAEVATLRDLGVPYGQGYYLGRPAAPVKS